jgi:hypothetical protein
LGWFGLVWLVGRSDRVFVTAQYLIVKRADNCRYDPDRSFVYCTRTVP